MLNIVDEAIDPCEDFFTHACGYFNEAMKENSNMINTDEPTLPPYLYNYEDRMNFFERNKLNFITPTGRLLGALYTSCKHRERSDNKRQWYRMLREIPFLRKNLRLYMDWPLLRHEWIDWIDLAAEFAAHGVVNFLRIFFAENTIYLAPVRAGEDVHCNSLDEWEMKLLTLRREGSKEDVQIIANELSTFCRLLIGEIPLNPKIHVDRDNEKQYNGYGYNESLIYDAFGQYLQLFFKRLEISEEEVIGARFIHIEKQRLCNIAALIQSTHPSILFNFVMWQAYTKLRYEDCFTLTEEFEDILLSEYWSWGVFNEYFSRKVALATYIYHTTRFQQKRRYLLMGNEWDRFFYAKLQRSDFNLSRLLSNYAKVSLDPSNITIIYGTDKFVKGDFYGNLLNFRRRHLRNTFFSHFIDPEDYNNPLYFLRHFLHFTILSLQRPLFHYFATLGFNLWHKSDLLYSSDGYYTALDCLDRQSLINFNNSSINQLLNESQVAEIFRFYRAFLESLRDYHFWIEGESFAFAEDLVLDHFHLTSKRVLFYAVTQLYCGRNNDWYALLINRSFMNMPQFETAFECDAQSAMNPIVKCLINNCEL